MHQCVECEETIRNPVCPDCLAQGIAALTGERLGSMVAHEVVMTSKALAYRFGSTWCIKCGEMMQLCAFCFVNELSNMLQSNPQIRTQLLEYCSFDFEKREYLPITAQF